MRYIINFADIGLNDLNRVGGKNASLGEMIVNLTQTGIRVPAGFATTSEAYWHFLNDNNLKARINDQLKDLNTHDIPSLTSTGKIIRNWIMHAKMPDDLIQEIRNGYKNLRRLPCEAPQPPKICLTHLLQANRKVI